MSFLKILAFIILTSPFLATSVVRSSLAIFTACFYFHKWRCSWCPILLSPAPLWMILVTFLCVDLDGRHEMNIVSHAHSPISKFSFNFQVCSSLPDQIIFRNGRCGPHIRGPFISINLYSNHLPVPVDSTHFPLKFPFTLLSALSIHAMENSISLHN